MSFISLQKNNTITLAKEQVSFLIASLDNIVVI